MDSFKPARQLIPLFAGYKLRQLQRGAAVRRPELSKRKKRSLSSW